MNMRQVKQNYYKYLEKVRAVSTIPMSVAVPLVWVRALIPLALCTRTMTLRAALSMLMAIRAVL